MRSAWRLGVAACALGAGPLAGGADASATASAAVPVAATRSPAPAPVAGWPRRVDDALGRSVSLNARPVRIVSLTPGNTEILFAIGAGDRIVGVTAWCNTPEVARALPKVGGFAATTVNLEAIVALRPDLVVAGDEAHRLVVETLAGLGIPAMAVKVRDFAGLFALMRQLGTVTDTADVAERVVRGLEDRVAAVATRTAAIPREQRPRVYWEVFDAPLMTAGRGSMLGRLIELAGGENLFADLREEYPQIGTEAVVTRDPQVILGADMAATGAGALTVERLRERPGWAGLTAVRTGRVVALPADPVSRPGPRLVDALEQVEVLLRADLRGVAPVEVKR